MMGKIDFVPFLRDLNNSLLTVIKDRKYINRNI